LASLTSSSSFTTSSRMCLTCFEKGLLPWTPSTFFVLSRNTTSQLLMILLPSTHIKRYALVLSQYLKSTQGMDFDSNLFFFSLGMCTYVLQPKTFKWNYVGLSTSPCFLWGFWIKNLVGHQFFM
jgi:hypothetical protein